MRHIDLGSEKGQSAENYKRGIMKRVLVALISISSSLFPASVLAELNYDAFSLGYGKISKSGYPDKTAYRFGFTKSLSDYAYVGAKYEINVQPSGSKLRLDLGLHAPLKDNTDLVFTGNLMNGSADVPGLPESSNGYRLSAGIRAELAPRFEGRFSCGYSKVNTSLMGSALNTTTGIDLNISIGYRITPQYELFAEMSSSTIRQVPIYSTDLLGFGAKIYY